MLNDCRHWSLTLIMTFLKSLSCLMMQVHHTRLVAAMMVHNVPPILIFIDRDLKRYREISIILPQEVLGDRSHSELNGGNGD